MGVGHISRQTATCLRFTYRISPALVFLFLIPAQATGLEDKIAGANSMARRLGLQMANGSQLMLSVGATPQMQLGKATQRERRLYLIDIAGETVTLWMHDAAEADWVIPGFVYAVNPNGKRISTWAALKESETP